MESHETDWRTILLLIGAAAGAVIAFGAAILMFAYAGFDALQPQPSTAGRSPFDFVVLTGAPIVIGLAFLPTIYYSIQRLRGRAIAAARPKLLSVQLGILLVLIWAGAAAGAGFLFDKAIGKWITPVLYVVAILVPAYFFLRLATGGLQPGSRQRVWGVLTTGIGLGIVPAVVLELMLALVVLIVLVIYLAFHPDLMVIFRQLATELQNSNEFDQALKTMGPFLTSPLALILGLLFFSGFSPLIEETAKSAATWTVFDRLSGPAQGFAIGAISGTAFGLVESLLVSATPDQSWTSTLLVRGASTMMHIMSASLTGWGIGHFRTRRRILPLLGMYLAAMSLHGLWNASVVVITLGGIRTAMASSGPDVAGVLMMALGVMVLVILCLAIPVGMWAINAHFRGMGKPATSASSGEKYTDTERRSLQDKSPSPPVGPAAPAEQSAQGDPEVSEQQREAGEESSPPLP